MEMKTLDVVEIKDGLKFVLSEDKKFYEVVGIDNSLVDLKIPSEYNGLPIKQIGRHAFQNFNNLTSVAVAEGIEKISDHAFESCTNLTEVSLPKSLIEIEYEAFKSCSNLEYI